MSTHTLLKKFALVVSFISTFLLASTTSATIQVDEPILGGTNAYNPRGEIFFFYEVGDFVSWNVNVDSAGEYLVELSYSAPFGNKINSLYVNDQKVEAVTFVQGQGVLNLPVSLLAGDNNIDIRRDQNDWGNVSILDFDVVVLDRNASRYEAENAVLSSELFLVFDETASAQFRVGMTDAGQLTWTFDTAEAGNYILRFGYSSPFGDKFQSLSLDGVALQSVLFPQSSLWTTTDYSVYLNAGSHQLTLSKEWGYMNFDYVEVVKQ